MTRFILVLIVTILGYSWAFEVESPVYRTAQWSKAEVGVTCADGGDPTVVGNLNGTLVVSCGKGDSE